TGLAAALVSSLIVYKAASGRRVVATYDQDVDVLHVGVRQGNPKYVVAGNAEFTIFADDNGVWAVELEVKKWEGGYEDALKRMNAAWVKRLG
ncbi:MAG: hypothetical protein ACP5MH_11330, partial [Thermoproteus sp.]